MDFTTSFPEVGDYSYISPLAGGALRGCWKAVNKKSHDVFAIKSIPKNSFTSADDNSKFSAEINLMKQANNRYISAFIELIEDATTYHVVMELPEGVCLKDHIEKYGPLPEKQIKEMISKIQFVLLYLTNELGLKYAILNSDTIYVDESGNLSRFVLRGLDSVLSKNSDPSLLAFIPPELHSRNLKHVNSNCWSIGILALFAFTGKIPYSEGKKEDVIKAVLTSHDAIPDTVPEDGKAFISSALTKNPLVRIALKDIFSSEFMKNVPVEIPSLNERRSSANPTAHKTKPAEFMSLRKTPSSTAVQSPEGGAAASYSKASAVHLSYKSNTPMMKHSNSKNKFTLTSFE